MNPNPQPAARPSWRRRNYLVNPRFQGKYTVLIMVGVFLVSSAMSTVLFGVLYDQARSRVLNPTVVHTWQNAIDVGVCAGAFATVMAAVFGVWTILFTHRISGPLFVIARDLKEVAEGRFPEKRALRKRDEFKELHEVLWRALDAMKAGRQSHHARLSEAARLAQAAAGADHSDRASALRTLVAHLEALCRETADDPVHSVEPRGSNQATTAPSLKCTAPRLS